MNTVALSMIVRDGSAFLRDCLESARTAVDEIVVGDTGSTDDSVQIAKGAGARVLSVPWNNDFAEARNRVLAEVNCDWVLSLDADEQLDSSAPARIRESIEASSCSGYQVTILNYVQSLKERVWDRPAKPNVSELPAAKGYPAYVEHENVRLFRRRPDLYFVGRVHESVGPRILETGGKLGHANFVIHHFGLAADRETRARKNDTYRELGRRKIREMPDDAQAHLELGLVELDNYGNLDEARELFQEACRLKPQFGLAWFFQGVALLKLDRPAEALEVLRKAQRLGHRSALVSETLGDSHYNLGHFHKAQTCYEDALRFPGERHSLLSKLGLACLRAGKTDSGLRQLREAVQVSPDSPELHDRLILAYVALGRIGDAAAAAEEKLVSIANPAPSDFLRAASLWANQSNWQQAAAALQAGLEVYPENDKLRQARAEVAQAGGIPILENLSRSSI